MKKTLISMMLALICCFGFLLSGCGATPEVYEISVYINGANFGTVDDISGQYTEGASVTITATPYENQTFLCWMHDGKAVSNKAQYTFTVNEQTSGSYIALFNCADLEYVMLDSFVFTNNILPQNNSTEQLLTELNINMGHSLNELVKVYSCTGDALMQSRVIELSNAILYEENKTPYAFDKTKVIYLEVEAKYLTITEDIELEYSSLTTFTIGAVDVGQPIANIENQDLNLTTNTATGWVLETQNPDTSYQKNQILINFANLSTFEFESVEQ